MKRSKQFLAAIDAFDSGDVRRALELMEGCAERDDPVACFMAALWYRDEEFGVVDIERSNRWLARLEELAEGGDAVAQCGETMGSDTITRSKDDK